jgi:TRIAD3 protein (E3 ubiquitin-protein ligase RNF216)
MSALDPKTFERLENMQQQDNIEAAGLDLAECPFCDFKADCELVKDDKELRCLNPKCAKTSCRLCDEETHIPMSCEEASKKKKHISARQKVEEAKSEALIRQCNRCKRKFIKDAGCNKMTCPKCGNTQCYVCGKDVRGYNHFDGGCPLQDNGGVRHIEDVQKAEARAVAEVRAIHPDLSDADLGVDPATRAKEAETAVGDGMEERRRLQAQVRAQARMLGLQARERLAVPPIPFFERPLAFDYPLYPVGAGNQQGPQTIGGGFNGAFPGIPHYVEQLFRPIPNPEQPVRQAIEQPLAQPPPQFLRPFLPYQWEQAGQQQIGQPPQPMPQLIPQYVGQPNQQNMAQLHQENMAQHHQPDMARQIQEQHQQVQLLFAEEARQHFPPQPTDPFQQQLGNMFYPF